MRYYCSQSSGLYSMLVRSHSARIEQLLRGAALPEVGSRPVDQCQGCIKVFYESRTEPRQCTSVQEA